MQNKIYSGFGLVGILIAVAVIALLAGGGGFYWKEAQNQKILLQNGNDAVKKAEELKTKIERQNETIMLDIIAGNKYFKNEKSF